MESLNVQQVKTRDADNIKIWDANKDKFIISNVFPIEYNYKPPYGLTFLEL